MDRRASWVTVHGFARSQTLLSNQHTQPMGRRRTGWGRWGSRKGPQKPGCWKLQGWHLQGWPRRAPGWRKPDRRRPWGDFPGGPVVKNPPTDAEDTGSVSGPGTEISHAVEQLSPCATTTEALVLKPAIHKRSHTMRSLCRASKSSPCSRQLEKAHAQQGRPSAAKNKQIIQFF